MPWRLGWMSNRLLIPAVLAGFTFALVTVFVPPVASLLGQGPPTWAGWLAAVVAAPVMLGVDAAYKGVRRQRSRREAAAVRP